MSVDARTDQRDCSHVKTGDSSSWTSLSIWMSVLTVISSSALALSASSYKRKAEEEIQYLQQVVGLFVCLSEQTERKCGHGVVAP